MVSSVGASVVGASVVGAVVVVSVSVLAPEQAAMLSSIARQASRAMIFFMFVILLFL